MSVRRVKGPEPDQQRIALVPELRAAVAAPGA